jgi:hypothetical protein
MQPPSAERPPPRLRHRAVAGLGILVAIAALLAAPPMRVAACSCAQADPVEAAARVDIVFVGAVADTREPAPGAVVSSGRQVSYLFAVEEVRKGAAEASVVVTSSADGGLCGAGFSLDARWLVYGTRNADGTYATNACEPNRLLSATSDLPDDAAEWPDEALATPDANTGISLQLLVMAIVIAGLAAFSGVAFLWRRRSSG